MSDWDILAPVENGDNQDDQENDDNDGVYFADGGADNDSFGTPGSSGPLNGDKNNDNIGDNSTYSKYVGNEAQSFNPRIYDQSKHNDFFDNSGHESVGNQIEKNQTQQQDQVIHKYQPPQASSNYYKDLPNSYTCRKIHESETPGYKSNKRRGRSRGPRGGRHMTSDSDSAMSSVPHELLEEGFDEKIYVDFHDAALQQRAELGIGKSKEMNSLYYFWCFYLRGHFDQSMYDEFLELARQDASGNSHYGIECYFRLCSYGLEQRWDPQVFDQFQDEALVDYRRGSTYGIEKIKGFLENHKYKFEIKPTSEMNAVLEKYPTFESFKQENNNGANNQKPRKIQFDNSRINESRSIPKHSFTLGGNYQPNTNNSNNNNNNNNRSRRGSNPRGGAANNSPNNFNRRGRQQYRHMNDEPREWTFGRTQPSSAPKPDNMNLNH